MNKPAIIEKLQEKNWSIWKCERPGRASECNYLSEYQSFYEKKVNSFVYALVVIGIPAVNV